MCSDEGRVVDWLLDDARVDATAGYCRVALQQESVATGLKMADARLDNANRRAKLKLQHSILHRWDSPE